MWNAGLHIPFACWAQDHTVFPAFENDSLLTLGSSVQQIDYEREWTRVLEAAARKQGRSDKRGDNGECALKELTRLLADSLPISAAST